MLARSAWLTVLTCALCACSQPPQFVGEPVLDMNPSGRTPLAGLLTFTTDLPARATLAIGDGANSTTVTPNDEFVTEHELMVLGLRPGRVNTVELSIEDADGRDGDARSFEIETDPLPDEFPRITVNISDPERMEPGVTFTPVNESDGDQRYLIALDAAGDVVWYADGIASEMRLDNGLFLGQRFGALEEFDMVGRIYRTWYSRAFPDEPAENGVLVEADTFHHETLVLPSGNFLALSPEVRFFDSYPSSETDPEAPWQPRNIIGDRLIEFRPDDGEIVREWSLFDLIDPYRVGYNSLDTGFYERAYEDVLDEPAPDWTHSNGLAYDAATDSVVISIRKMSTLAKLDMGSSELVWLLGDPTGWNEPWSELLLEPDGELLYSYGHHAPKLIPDGTLLVYDNGTYGRAFPPNPQLPLDERFSRAVEYRIDEDSGTVNQVWSYGGLGSDRFLSGYVSEADYMPQTGNVLLTNGGQRRTPDGDLSDFGDDDAIVWISLMEVTRTTPADKVWEVVIDAGDTSLQAYRSERLPSLYP